VNRRHFVAALGSGFAAALIPAVRPSARAPVRFIERWSWAMGQPVHLQLFAGSDDQGYAAAEAALAELWRVEKHLSLFNEASDLMELNRRAGRRALHAGSDLQSIVRASLRFERETAGAFDVAIEPLMRAWGFHAHRSSEPTPFELAKARAAVAHARIVEDGELISLPASETQLDFGGIGVGYGLDRAIEVLRKAGITSAFLDVSGDCLALGAPPGESGWLVEIAAPQGNGKIVASTRIADLALATSANSRSVVEYHRALRGHVMNPRTGWPADALGQVTVVARTGIEADALSTAMLVSGKPTRGVMRYYTA
jgi:FAD:protein FMN transferase